MIKINLYDYQRVAQEVTVQKMVVTAMMIIGGAIVVTVMAVLQTSPVSVRLNPRWWQPK